MQVFLLYEKISDSFLKKAFKTISVEEDKIILNFETKKLKLKNKIKIVNKINKIVKNNKNLIISKKLKKDKELMNILYSNNFNIINGKKLFKILINRYVEYICEKNNIQISNSSIAITINDEKNINMKDIEELAKKCKTLSIITNNIKYFQELKENLWSKFGIILIVTNNKKKSLIKTDIILNYDFPREIINKYSIKDNAILINLGDVVKINKKRFNGKIINDYKIKLKNNSNIEQVLMSKKYEEFDLNDLAEIYILNSIDEIDDIIFTNGDGS